MLIRLNKFVETDQGKIIMSILLGFGLATVFRETCKGKNCVIEKAPPLEEIEGKIYQEGDKCYKFTLKQTKCDRSKRIVHF
jgi:hypothetical protein